MAQVDSRPRYEAPKITSMDRDEVLRAFQMSAAQISAAGCWWSTGCARRAPGCARTLRVTRCREGWGPGRGMRPRPCARRPVGPTRKIRRVVHRQDQDCAWREATSRSRREICFTVVELHKDLHDYDDMSEMSRRQRLHRHMHNEMQTLEIVAQGLVDFPDVAWEIRMQLARQCWDEARHSASCIVGSGRWAATRVSSR